MPFSYYAKVFLSIEKFLILPLFHIPYSCNFFWSWLLYYIHRNSNVCEKCNLNTAQTLVYIVKQKMK